MSVAYTLELFHISDQEASTNAFVDAPRLSAVVNALRAQDLFNDGVADNTLFLSSGDAYIPSPFFDASAVVFGDVNARGVADILIQNAIGIQAIAFGNHEFDLGTPLVRSLLQGGTPVNNTGTNYPYLSCNLNFTADTLNALVVPSFQAPQPRKITGSVVFTVGGQLIGVVGATTPTLRSISSPGNITANPVQFSNIPTGPELDALAAIIQAEVNGLIAANAGMNKVILLTHMQQLDIEFSLASRLRNVDIIAAGGSHTRLFDANDRVRAGDSVQGVYPTIINDLDGKPVAVVNTDANYKYVGRLVIGFDASGTLLPSSYNATVSGAYATDAQGVASLNAGGLVNPEVQRLATLLEAAVIATESNILGYTRVFLNGERGATNDPNVLDGVRTQETNLGDLTADANLYYGRLVDPTVTVSIKNGGGIRFRIGEFVVPANSTSFVRQINAALTNSNGTVFKPSGAISQNDVVTTLAFNNGLSLVTVTKAQLVGILEYGIGALPVSNGRHPQVGGVSFSYNLSLPSGSRIRSAFITSVNPRRRIVSNGVIVGSPNETFRVVTLDFMLNGGDGYTFPNTSRVDLRPIGSPSAGVSNFSAPGTEQDAMAEFLLAFHGTNATAYSQADTDRRFDQRMQDLAFVPNIGSSAPSAAPSRSPVKAPVKASVPAPVPVKVPVPVPVPVPVKAPSPVPVPVAPVAIPVAPVPAPKAPVPVPVAPVPAPKAPVPAPVVPVPAPEPVTVPVPVPKIRLPCGLLGFSIFCPGTGCGLLGRIFGTCFRPR
jgi:uncharacterized protein